MRAQKRYTLDRRRAGTDDRNRLVREFSQSAGVIAPRVVVVPARGMERVSLVILNSRNAG